ncbi:MAG: glycosyltransferase family 4 protein [Deltaproteobacteria bacterium]|nr:glycosyltransferase family 4 protein [Deltaproteobacteria bacterium]
MLIWLIQTGEPLPIKNGVRKMRTAVLADKLLERGHKVLWWASAFEHQQKIMISKKDRKFDISERYTIRVIGGCKYRKNISFARYIDHQIVALKFRIQSQKFPKPDIIVASIPDHLLAYEAARYARKRDIPFLVDIRDLWPDIFLDRFKNMGLYGLGKIVLARDFMLLASLLKSADALAAMSEGILQWGLDKIGRPKGPFDKVFYLGYKVYSDKATGPNESSEMPAWLKKIENKKLFIFIGTFGISYELDLILEAARRFDTLDKKDICFVLAGTGEYFDMIRKKASGLKNVMLSGWIGENEIKALLKKAYVGLVPCRSVENAMPNKPFEYLSVGLPLISSLEGEMAELINQHWLGLNYLPGDLEGLYDCIERLASDPALHDKMSLNALDFFNKYGDADKIYDEYAEHIERLVEHKERTNSKVRS